MTDQDSGSWRWVSGSENAHKPTVIVEDNPEVGRLHGPDGSLVKIIRARPERPLGFRPDRDQL